MSGTEPFRVGLTRSLFHADGTPAFDFGLEVLEARSDIAWEVIPTDETELPAAALAGYDAIIVELPGDVTARSVEGNDRLRLVARVGVGYDSVDVPALDARGILLTNTPDGVRRSMATAAVTFVLMLSQHVTQRDRLSHEGRWADRGGYVGIGLTGRVLGLVGLGNIGREVARLIAPWDMEVIASDPYVTPEQAASVGCTLTSLDEVLSRSDFVVITCALVPETYRLISAERIGRMKESAFLINIARGPIVDQAALTQALIDRRIAGAGLDVFEDEPMAPDDPLMGLDNVVLTAHSIGWTDQCFRDCGLSAIESVISVAEGRLPATIVDRAALAHPRWAGWKEGSTDG
ncbi:MAG: dehydrogenase [Chloroflexi bacterium]|nr:dehydrogenase [Chloroflexota bacterium]